MPNRDHHEDAARCARFDKAEIIVRLALAANVILMVLKLVAGRVGRSDAVFADGIESACDMAISAGTLIALRISRQPFDRNHPYGHGRAEGIGALLVGCAIVGTGLWILSGAVSNLVTGHAHRPTWVAVVAAAFTIVTKEALARITFDAGTRLGSPVLGALGHDHRKDAMTSIGTLVGCGGAALGLTWLDPLAAGLTALLIGYAGLRTMLNASHDLMDTSLPEDTLQRIAALAAAVDGVDAVHEIRGRRSGQYSIVDLKLDMDPQMTVQRSHDLAAEVKRRIFAAHADMGDVMIHINPSNDPNHEDLVRL